MTRPRSRAIAKAFVPAALRTAILDVCPIQVDQTMRFPCLIILATGLLSTASPAIAAADDPEKPGGHAYDPTVAPASPDAARSMASFRVGNGLKLELFAAEPLLANPVAFGFDEKGKVYVVETFRLHHGVTDNRGHMGWLDDDLASKTVADRVAMYKKHLGKEAATYATEHDRIRLVEDRDGDGKADHSTVFADGFNDMADGLAAGVLARKGDVYFTNIPSLWMLRDQNGDGKADFKKALHTGYGVHVAFLGHDLHGLRFGPDGRLYFSIGDRGLNVTTADGRKLYAPDTGSILRCEPDGSKLEIHATGLRNPQELAFDEFGNLFTVDNNSDSGDKARLVYVIEGGDSGWRMGYQYLESPESRGPWNAEKLWYPQFNGQASYIVPPLVNLSDGPSGLTYNPGVTLLPSKYAKHFFLADFRGSSNLSGLRSFTVRPNGAAFELGESEQFLWGMLATDVDFGPDGALYVSDWVEGWNLTGKGRIYKLSDPSVDRKAADEVKRLLAEGFEKRSIDELTRLLAHADQRVRQEAQFALADQGEKGIQPLRAIAEKFGNKADRPEIGGRDRLSRLHAIWALGQIGRRWHRTVDAAIAPLAPLLKDSDEEIRAQAAKVLGESGNPRFAVDLLDVLGKDSSPRVRSLAAIALGKLGDPQALPELVKVLRANDDKDPFLRHAAVMGLASVKETEELMTAAKDSSPAVRRGILLALRRRQSPEASKFLNDSDPSIVTEAARAIYDVPIASAMPALASLADRPGLDETTLRRVINAIPRSGDKADPKALASLAARPEVPRAIRIEALEILGDWAVGSGRDRVTGLWRPIGKLPADAAVSALASVFEGLLKDPSPRIQLSALRAIGPLPLKAAGPTIAGIVADTERPYLTRVTALKALDRLADPRLGEAVLKAVKDPESAVRIEGQRLLAKLRPDDALPVLSGVLDSGQTRERQGAFATLASMPAGGADEIISRWMTRLKEGKVAAEVELDLLDAARQRKSEAITKLLEEHEAIRPKDDPVALYRESLVGGDASRGAKILAEKAEVSCVRCHKVKGKGGEVGPELTGIGTRQDRRYLLEAIVAPNKQIAKGFETLLLATDDGQVISGILKEETADSVRLMTPEGRMVTIAKARIEERKTGTSAMPTDLLQQLSKAEIRDLVEYLTTLK